MNVMKAYHSWNYTDFKNVFSIACTHSDRNLNLIPTAIRKPHTNPSQTDEASAQQD